MYISYIYHIYISYIYIIYISYIYNIYIYHTYIYISYILCHTHISPYIQYTYHLPKFLPLATQSPGQPFRIHMYSNVRGPAIPAMTCAGPASKGGWRKSSCRIYWLGIFVDFWKIVWNTQIYIYGFYFVFSHLQEQWTGFIVSCRGVSELKPIPRFAENLMFWKWTVPKLGQWNAKMNCSVSLQCSPEHSEFDPQHTEILFQRSWK